MRDFFTWVGMILFVVVFLGAMAMGSAQNDKLRVEAYCKNHDCSAITNEGGKQE